MTVYKDPKRETLTVDEVAKILGISRMSAWNAVWRGDIRVLRIGRRTLVPRVAIDELLNETGGSSGGS